MPHSASVALLCSLLKPDNDARPTFLFGGGTSFSSGIPLAGEGVNRLAKQVYAERVLGGKTFIEQIKVSEWTDWLHRQPWFVCEAGHLAENFPLLIQHQLQPEGYRRNLLLDLVALQQELGAGYVPWWNEYPGMHIPAPLELGSATSGRHRFVNIAALRRQPMPRMC